ncbi:MAG: DEAD/DEAH box helicase [Chloroflexi bacterium]|nr:DEAD/DEAH box helicase [Chloroflexota bacterium]
MALAVETAVLDQFRASLPYSLTAAQERVIAEITSDMAQPIPMNRLLQGDVGSGKTVVAAAAMIAAAKAGAQAALMAPTEILAEQHFNGLNSLLSPLGINSGCSPAAQPPPKERRSIRAWPMVPSTSPSALMPSFKTPCSSTSSG